MPNRIVDDSIPALLWPRWRATMHEWQGNKSWIQRVKLHSYIAYKVADVGLRGQHGYPLSYVS